MEKPIYPFAAIVGQEEMKLVLSCALYTHAYQECSSKETREQQNQQPSEEWRK